MSSEFEFGSYDEIPQFELREMTAPIIHKHAERGRPFLAGTTLHGVPGPVDFATLGKAREFHTERGYAHGLRLLDHYALDAPHVTYTVLSFDTPIAWLHDRYWTVVSHDMGSITRRHLPVVRGLLGLHF